MLAAWIDILIQANWRDGKTLIGRKVLDFKRGESLKSLDTWAERWGWNKSAVRRFLNSLEMDGMIRTANETVTTRISICNYESYQNIRNGNETQVTPKRNASETEVTPEEQGNKETIEQENIGEPVVKIEYAEHVRMTEEEYHKLIAEYGETETAAFIDRLNTYKGSTGKKYKSDYMTMHSWVIKAVIKESKQPQRTNGKSNGRTYTPDADQYAEIARKYGITDPEPEPCPIPHAIVRKV